VSERLQTEDSTQELGYVVGAEADVAAILTARDMEPVLKAVVGGAVSGAQVVDRDGKVLATWGAVGSGTETVRKKLFLEGEPAAEIVLVGTDGLVQSADESKGEVARAALQAMLNNSLKRVLTTEIHTRVVRSSYDELVEANRRLTASEARYRELAETLDRKLDERTRELETAYARMLQREKMAAVGQLAAGVAHEINNPLGFIASNLATFGRYAERVETVLRWYRTALEENLDHEKIIDEGAAEWRRNKIDFVLQDTKELLRQSAEGTERVKKIVSDLKGFSHVDDTSTDRAVVNEEIERVLRVLAPQLPPDAEIELRLGDVPELPLNPALLGQVLVNLIMNAVDQTGNGLRLILETTLVGDNVRIVVQDNGPGIPEENRTRVFEPFFTTKEVGAGTGMGLAVAHDIVTGAGGAIHVESAPDTGARFVLHLPAIGDCHG